MSKTNREVVHEGWLIKSPPTKRIWRARWRRRWFTLRHTGELPGQFFLEYYTDRNCRKLKGTIDLDQCEQVDAGLLFEQRKSKYPFMFDVKTPSRVYYLAAESEEEMNKWVDCICQVCGLKAFSDEQELQIPASAPPDLVDIDSGTRTENLIPDTPPLSPISGPYIPISECITGLPMSASNPVLDFYCLLNMNATNTALSSATNHNLDSIPFIPPTPQKRRHQQQHSFSSNDLQNEDPRFYDLPRQLQPPELKSTQNLNTSLDRAGTPPLQSPTDSESVFTTDDEWTNPMLPAENGLKEPRPSDSSLEMEPSSWSVVQRFGKLTVVDSPTIKSENAIVKEEAPPRPPKPSHLGKGPSYLNLDLDNSPKACRLKINPKEQVELVGTGACTSDKTTPNLDVDKDASQGQVISDEMYDFPRSHNVNEPETSKTILANRHCYNNAAPSIVDGQVFRYDISATEAMATEPSTHFDAAQDEEPASPCSQSSCSTTAMYSNLPSPLLPDTQSGSGPPLVNRCLKPGRKLSDSASICSLPEPSSPRSAPNVDRKLKPSSQPQGRKTSEVEFDSNSLRLPRAAPSPTPGIDEDSVEQVYFYEVRNQFLAAPRGSKHFEKLQYLDLDLESDAYNSSMNSTQPPKSPGPQTVYKTVDFVKTEAFKRTRQGVEAARQKCNGEP